MTIDSAQSEKKADTLVYIFNMSEDVWPFITAMSDARSRMAEVEENTYLADLRLFVFAGESDNLIFISPTAMSEAFLAYFKSLFGNKHITVLVTKTHTGVTSRDAGEDEGVMQALITAANSSKRLTVTSYATTLPFLEFVRELRKRGLTIYTPETPEEEDAWTVNFYGSKSGIRQLAQQSGAIEPDFQMPRGLICMGIEDAASIAAKKYVKDGGVVIKTNKGHSGMGLLLLRPGDLPSDYHVTEREIFNKLKKESYWQKFPIVIEDLISVNTSIGGGCPNVEFKIMKNGRVEFLYYCAMRVSPAGVFNGVEIHNEVVTDRVAAQMVDTGFFIGEQYAAAGYRGYYDVDFVAGKNGQLYVTESNVRSTGGTFVYATALELFGKDFMYATYLLSNNSYNIAHISAPTLEKMQQRLAPVLFTKATGEGLIIVSENLFRMGKLAYMIFGKTKKRAYELEARMEEFLRIRSGDYGVPIT